MIKGSLHVLWLCPTPLQREHLNSLWDSDSIGCRMRLFFGLPAGRRIFGGNNEGLRDPLSPDPAIMTPEWSSKANSTSGSSNTFGQHGTGCGHYGWRCLRSGFATKDLDTAEYEDDLPTTTSALLDVNNVSVPPQVSTLNALAGRSHC